ncbi:unnamed protein product [Rotaria sordida]|uniref:Uncharacterized protein n=1 Tax=Rotaria sordida TaxID=392033 RepID=A0A815Q5X3_9BILA|nr:unnamed protein product [Rotaria sordida]
MVSTVIRCFVFILFSFTVRVTSQICYRNQYDRCSTTNGCACLHIAGAPLSSMGLCSYQFSVDCLDLHPCEPLSNFCPPEYECVYHPRCNNVPVCYPVPRNNRQICPPIPGSRTNS